MNHAQRGILSLILEVSANPKPGNVDREHEFKDLRYEHFIISAIAVYPIFEDCVNRRGSIGINFFKAVEKSYKICKTNVHFGAFFILIPLIWCKGNVKLVKGELKKTTYHDSIAVLNAFRMCKPRVIDVDYLSLKENIEKELIDKEINLYNWLLKSPEENVVAREIVEGYWRCLEGSKVLIESYKEFKELNYAIVYTYLFLMSKYLDPLIIAKHGRKVAEDVRIKAGEILEDFNIDNVRKFDEELLTKNINPGSIADLTCASIYLSLGEIV